MLVPYRGLTPPRDVLAALPAGFAAGSLDARGAVALAGARWEVGRDLAAGRAWCTRLEG